jgi:hypothetical protein
MEESQSQPQNFSQQESPLSENKVSFPTVGEEKKNGGAKTLLIVGILVLIGILGYVIFKSATNKSSDLSESDTYENTAVIQEESTPVPSLAPTSSPSASVDKTETKIQVQNGTGITGEAAYLQTQLKGIGYTSVSVGNSAKQNQESTQVSFSASVPSSVVTEITAKLNSIYQTVTKVSSTSTTYDIVIVTGLKKGATPKPSVTPTSSPSSSPTPTATP